jgi:hypothetical protein
MVFAQDSNSFFKGGLIFDTKNMKMGFMPKGHTTWITLANAQWGTSTIGTEFFSLKSLANINAARGLVGEAAVQFSQIETLSELIRLHDNPPYGMYCIAAEEYVIGQKKKVSKGWPWKLKDIPEQVMHVERTTDTNRGSLCHIVAWPSQNNQLPRVSHYLGADLNARAEAYILNWLDKSGVTRITCMKASHHGARTSNLPLFLKKFRPKRIIISAKDMHGHLCKYSLRKRPGGHHLTINSSMAIHGYNSRLHDARETPRP